MNNLSEEEKKAIEYFEKALLFNYRDLCEISKGEIRTILNLIDKQQKEIKKLTRLNSAYKTNYDSKVLKEERKSKRILEGYISKDKIKELKEKVKNEQISNPYDFSYMINELLEE